MNKDTWKEIQSWLKMLVICIVSVFLLNNYIIVNAEIPSSSMEDTMRPGNRVVALRLAYLSSKPKRGDIVIFKQPVEEALGRNKPYIKRIIGLPGEKVEINDARIYINDSEVPLEENYLKEAWVIRNDNLIFQVPEGYYFVLGDNRNDSLDSRYWAEWSLDEGLTDNLADAEIYSYVSEKKILGKAEFKYWPLNEISMLK